MATVGEHLKDHPRILELYHKEQLRAGNIINSNIALISNSRHEGFDWLNSLDGAYFWRRIIFQCEFNLFYEKYDKKSSLEVKEQLLNSLNYKKLEIY